MIKPRRSIADTIFPQHTVINNNDTKTRRPLNLPNLPLEKASGFYNTCNPSSFKTGQLNPKYFTMTQCNTPAKKSAAPVNCWVTDRELTKAKRK